MNSGSLVPLAKSSPEDISTSDGSEPLYEVQTTGKRKDYVCKFPECGKSFRYKSEIFRHIATHSEQRPHSCPYESCRKTFKRSDALENHVRTHTKETPFVCDVPECGITFTTKASLRYHLLKHKNQKVYKCSIPGCNKAFITVFQLKQHEKSTIVHKRLHQTNSLNKQMTQLPESCPVYIQNQPTKLEIPPFKKVNVGMEWEAKMPFYGQKVFEEPPTHNIVGEQIRGILGENQILKKKLELSQRIIGLLQQKIQYETLPMPDYPAPNLLAENFMRFPYFDNPEY